jgi:hypothetical protein
MGEEVTSVDIDQVMGMEEGEVGSIDPMKEGH